MFAYPLAQQPLQRGVGGTAAQSPQFVADTRYLHPPPRPGTCFQQRVVQYCDCGSAAHRADVVGACAGFHPKNRRAGPCTIFHSIQAFILRH